MSKVDQEKQVQDYVDDNISIFEMPGDWFLRSFVENVIGLGAEVGMTLSIGGSVVTGVAIEGEKYMDLFADQFTNNANASECNKIVGESLREWKQIYQKPDDAPDDWKSAPIGYIHLMDARYCAPGKNLCRIMVFCCALGSIALMVFR